MLPHHPYERTPAGLLVPAGSAIPRTARRPRAIDLFAGCGGMSLGLIQGGFEVLAGVDHDPDAAHTYMHNLGAYPCRFVFLADTDRHAMEQALAREATRTQQRRALVTVATAGSGWRRHHPEAPGVGTFFLGDIRQLRGADLMTTLGLVPGELDLIAGGPPCQGFSLAGKRHVMDPRNSLVFEFARLVCEVKPKTMVMENVPGMLDMVTPDGVPVLDALARILEDGGFGGYDAFRKSVAAQAGAMGLLRGHPPATAASRKPSPQSPPEASGAQLDLFADLAA